jgi:hypothetical protein
VGFAVLVVFFIELPFTAFGEPLQAIETDATTINRRKRISMNEFGPMI